MKTATWSITCAGIVRGLRQGLYGASFRVSVIKERFVRDPGRSGYNPDGLPERTIREAKVMEFVPVTFPAYPGATAGVRARQRRLVKPRLALDGDRPYWLLGEAEVPHWQLTRRG